MKYSTAALTGLAIVIAFAAPSPCLSQELPPRPTLADYEDQNRFVADVLAWEEQRKRWLANPPAPTVSTSHDWHHVNGPEDLDTALTNAEGYQQPNYTEKLRYNRTTHISFPLHKLAPEEMAVETVIDEPNERKVPMAGFQNLPNHMILKFNQLQEFVAQEQPSQLLSTTN